MADAPDTSWKGMIAMCEVNRPGIAGGSNF